MANTQLLFPTLNFYLCASIIETLSNISIKDFSPLEISHSALYHHYQVQVLEHTSLATKILSPHSFPALAAFHSWHVQHKSWRVYSSRCVYFFARIETKDNKHHQPTINFEYHQWLWSSLHATLRSSFLLFSLRDDPYPEFLYSFPYIYIFKSIFQCVLFHVHVIKLYVSFCNFSHPI